MGRVHLQHNHATTNRSLCHAGTKLVNTRLAYRQLVHTDVSIHWYSQKVAAMADFNGFRELQSANDSPTPSSIAELIYRNAP
jgi:hypothetical protein